MSSQAKRVAVIGAGVSGLAAAKCLLDEGLTPVVFEQSAHIGGIWNYDERLPDRRDLKLRGLGFTPIRYSGDQLEFDGPTVIADLESVVNRSEQLAARESR